MSEVPKEQPQFKNPQEELAYLRAQIAEKEKQLAEAGIEGHSDHAAREVVSEYAARPPEEALHETFELSDVVADEIVLDLAPDDDDEKIGELLGIAHTQGIKNAFSILEKLNSPHLEDDFHKVLVEYVKTGYLVRNLSEHSPLWDVLHMTLYEVSLPETASEEEKGKPLKEMVSAMEQFYAGMLGGGNTSSAQHFAIEVAVDEKRQEAVYYLAVPTVKKALFEKQLLSIFPKAHIFEQKNDYNIFVKDGTTKISVAEFAVEPMFPVKPYQEFDYDPLNVIVNAFSKIEATGEGAALQIIIHPEGDRHVKRYRSIIEKLEKGKKLAEAIKDTPESVAGEVFKVFREFASVAGSSKKKDDEKEPPNVDQNAIEQIRKKVETAIPSVTIKIAVSSENAARAADIIEEIESTFNQFENTLGNRFKFHRIPDRQILAESKKFAFREYEPLHALPLSLRELSSVMHFPQGGMASAPHLAQIKAGTAPAPLGLPQEGTLLGANVFRNQETKAYLTQTDRVRHLYVIGQTGTGKSVFLKNLIIQDIKQGYGGCFIDPHGSDVQDILANIPKERYEDVVYFDPAYTERVMGLNMLEYDEHNPEQKTFVVNEMLAIFNKLFDMKVAGGPMFEQYFRNATMLVLEDPASGSTLLDVSRVLADARFRELKLSRAKNPVVVQFWREIASKAQGEAGLANIVPYITSKFDVFNANDIMRPIIAQQKSAFNFRELMDNRKILLVNLSKGRLGDINANLIGLILVGKILMAALSRADSYGTELPPFYLHIDEFQNITTDSIATILSEARKYKLGLTVAHQFIAQLEDNIRDAVFGNVGSMAVFRVGAEDAEVLEPQFRPVFTANDIMNIDNFNCYVRLLANGKPVKPFNVKTYPSPKGNLEQVEYLKQLSYFKHGKPREEVENQIGARYRSV